MIPRFLCSVLLLVFAVGSSSAATFTVTNTADSGAGSLRNAITQANTTPGADTIAFNISGAGVHTITPVTALPTITDSVTIDGYTQPGSSANANPTTKGLNTVLKIELSGGGLGSFFGLEIEADNCTVRGLVINSFFSAIHVSGGHNGSLIEGNFIGTDPTGTVARPNGNDPVVWFDFNSNNNTLGGTTPAARNLISGNGAGAAVECDGTGDIVQGNLIGTDITGTLALGNPGRALNLTGANALVGGTTVAARNIISGNGEGVDSFIATGPSTIQGNFIGTDVTGTVALPNSGFGGVRVLASGWVVGGLTATPGAPPGNLISGNGGAGVNVAGVSSTLIQGNLIGTDVTGTQPLGNHQQGILIVDNGGTPSHDNTIGGTAAGAANIIAFNGDGTCDFFGDGVAVRSNSGNINNAILGNSIFSNFGLGIQLEIAGAPDCVNNPNDTGDVDTGANNLQNYPVLTSVTNSGGMTHIAGKLNSVASKMYRVEFFANAAIDPSGYGEGQTYLGFINVPTNASGNGSFNFSVPQIASTRYVTATATDPNGNTSEFSAAIGQLLNISTRLKVLTGNSVLIGGFIVGGSGNKTVLMRALGPTLHNFGITGFLADPTLELHAGNGTLLMSNDNWKDMQQTVIAATGLAPPNDLESAILHTFTAGNYTGIVRGKNNSTGVALFEVYDVDKAFDTTLTNISTRGFVDIGQNLMIGGFISGNGIVRVIVRALGPTLTQFGVTNVLADPTLELHDANGTIIASNDNWKDTQQAEIQASGFAPPNNAESAIIITRPPGNTTAIVSGKNNTTGNALVEVYILPP